jgi:uncharacterized membrane protein
MNTSSPTKTMSPKGWVLPVVLVTLLAIALYYISGEFKYFSLDPDVLGNYFPIKWWLVGHLTGGILALIIGPFQFWTKFRNRNLKLHRNLGKIYLIAILIAVISSTVMAWTASLSVHWTWAVSLQGLAFAWIVTAFMAYRTIRQKRVQEHRKWMIRSYIVTFAFITFRWINNSEAAMELGSFVERAPTIAWAVWAIPLLVAEIIFDWNKK